jgi:predicted amidohydrolase
MHKSAIVIDCGKLSGVSDMAHVIDESVYSPGGNFRVYDTSRGKIGIIIGEDLYFSEVPRMLTLCDSDLIINLFGKIYDHIPQIVMRAASFCNGISICMAAESYTQVSDIKGEILCAGDAEIIECNLDIIKDYHLLQSRKRGYYKEIFTSY